MFFDNNNKFIFDAASAKPLPNVSMVTNQDEQGNPLVVPEGWVAIEPKMGALGAFGFIAKQSFIAKEVQTASNYIGALCNSGAIFALRLQQIVDFYSNTTSRITQEEAHSFLRLLVYGGGVSKWVQGMACGSFETSDKLCIGRTAPKPIRNGAKEISASGRGYWPKPYDLNGLMKEVSEVTDAFCAAHQAETQDLCEDLPVSLAVEGGTGNIYRRNARVMSVAIMTILGRLCAEAMNCLAENLIVAGTEDEYEAVVDISRILFKTGPNFVSVEHTLAMINSHIAESGFTFVQHPSLPKASKGTVATKRSHYSIFTQNKKAK